MADQLRILKKFWKNKKVFITGHTGFKGSWLTIFFNLLGAKVYGYSLKQEKISFYNLAKIDKIIKRSIIGDIRNYNKLYTSIKKTSPNILIHLAAQPLVRDSYDKPRYTYDVNTMGTLNVLNILKELGFIKYALIITTDKVYKNLNKNKFFNEDDELGGHDPYSNSKACAELITHAYSNSFLSKKKISCATVRAGNVIGGGDFAKNRIIPDFIKAFKNKKKLSLRYPNAIRPWQHVIEPLYGYLLLLMHMIKSKSIISGPWNFGPSKSNNIKVKEIISILNSNFDNSVKVINKKSFRKNYKESELLKLSSKKSNKILKWKPKYNIIKTMKLIHEWNIEMLKNKNKVLDISEKQIKDFINQY